jgi:hypothetical protein
MRVNWFKRFERILHARSSDRVRSQAPFPGKYPTRMWVRARLDGANTDLLAYFGKPSWTPVRGATKLLAAARVRGTLLIAEVDRNAVIAVHTVNSHPPQVFRPDFANASWNLGFNNRLWYSYHPFQKGAVRVFNWLDGKTYVKRSKETRFVRYSAQRKDPIEAIKVYKETVQGYGLTSAAKTN